MSYGISSGENCPYSDAATSLTKSQELMVTSASIPHGRLPAQGDKRMFGGSWASVAATETVNSNKIVKFRPADGIKKNAAGNHSVADATAKRVVWISPWDKKKPLSCVTEQIHQGPLLSMAYSDRDGAVCIIFQRALHARAFLETNAEHVRRNGHSLFGSDTGVLEGDLYQLDEDLQRMEPPFNERRRLTFARQRLFADGMDEQKFKQDIFACIGESNVELVWLFNSGNGKWFSHASASEASLRCSGKSHSGACGVEMIVSWKTG